MPGATDHVLNSTRRSLDGDDSGSAAEPVDTGGPRTVPISVDAFYREMIMEHLQQQEKEVFVRRMAAGRRRAAERRKGGS